MTSSHTALFFDPLHTEQLRALPQFEISGETVLSGSSLTILFNIYEYLKRLAPTGPDDERSLWIDAVRGEPSEWGDYERMLTQGLVSSREDYLRQWEESNPEEVTWWRITTRSCRDKVSLVIMGEDGSHTQLTNRKYPSDDSDEDESVTSTSMDYSDTLFGLFAYLLQVVKSIEDNPDAYNDYLDAHLPRRQRSGTIWLADYWCLGGDDPSRDLTGEDVEFLHRKAYESVSDSLMQCPMTLGLYARAWVIAYKALCKCSAERDQDIPTDAMEAFLVLSGYGYGTHGVDPDDPEAFVRWAEEARFSHGFTLPSESIALYPEREPDGCTLSLVCSYETEIVPVVRIARALEKAHIGVVLKGAREMGDYASGRVLLTIDAYSFPLFQSPHRRFPERASEEFPKENLEALDKAISWEPLHRVVPYAYIFKG